MIEQRKVEKEISFTNINTAPTGYTLVWNDEFNGTTLDISKWVSDRSCTYWNLIASNTYLDGNSNVVFRATNDSNGINGGYIASGCDPIGTYKYAFTYGYIELRAKAPDTNQIDGIGWDMWLSGSTQWPPEIDITESGSGPYNTYSGINCLNMTRHCCADNDSTCDGTNEGSGSNCSSARAKGKINVYIKDIDSNPVNLGKDFHIYGCEWTPTYVSWLLDGVEVNRVTTGIPKTPMYIIAGIAPGSVGNINSNTPFPSYMYLDYVRIYQKSTTPTLSKITVSPSSTDVNVGSTVQLTANCTDQNGDPISCALAWNSSNTLVATVDPNGLVTGIIAGTVNVTASSGTIQSNASIVTVKSAQILSSILTSPTSTNVNVGSTIQLTTTCKDQNTNTMKCPTLSWSSSNTSVATVDPNGLVTGIIAGTVNVTASSGTIQSNASVIIVTTTTNLILNPGVENGTGSGTSGVPNNWGKYSAGTTPSAPYTWPEIGRNNTKAVAINFPRNYSGRSSWIQTITTTSGLKDSTLYTLSGYMKLQNVVASGGARIGIDWYSSPGYLSSQTITTQTGTKDWPTAPYSGIVTSPSGVTKAVIWLQLINASGKVYFDDISLTAKA